MNTKIKFSFKNFMIIATRIITVVCVCILLYFYFFPETLVDNILPEKVEKLPKYPRVTEKEAEKIEENIEKKEKEATQKHEERKQKGDTLAISDKKLAEYLPKNPLGFTKTNKTTQNPYNVSGQQYANAEQEYKKDNVFLRINLIDYNAGNSPDVTTSAYWSKNLGSEDNNERSAGFSLKNKMVGWEIFFKKKKIAEITVAISDRFTLIMKANQQENCEMLKQIAGEMIKQLDELAKK